MDFDSVKSRCLGIGGPVPIGFHDPRNFLRGQRPRRDKRRDRPHQAYMACWSDRTGCHRLISLQKERMRNPSDVPELQQNVPALIMNRLGDQLPALDLFF